MAAPKRKTKAAEKLLQCISPVDGSVYMERPFNTLAEVDATLTRSKKAQASWRKTPLAERQKIMLKALDYFLAHAQEIAVELTWMMGRPVSQTPGEINRGFQERIRYMVNLAPKALADVVPEAQAGFKRYLRREPLGVVAVIAPWNYPYLTAVNSIVPALLAGNAVILKHSPQTPLCADRFAAAFKAAGLPKDVFQFLDLTNEDAEKMIADPRIDYVNFTGSVKTGHAVQKAISGKFIGAGLELGGNDPAYVRRDANLKYAIENVVDGAFFNSGQCCCGLERVYVHESLYKDFVDGCVALTKTAYKLGNPMHKETNLGPVISTAAAAAIRDWHKQAIKSGAKALIDEKLFPMSKAGTPYIAPQIFVNMDHSMPCLKEEVFGPTFAIMKVKSDEEAVRLMNDSPFGLTVSIWTEDVAAVEKMIPDLETGTVFMNRCDYVDPGLSWTGVKNSGRGASLGLVGFENLTRPKSIHLRTKI